ncbi:hypothetical protein FRX31_030179 [Thalictrum thalictroides]|uniref:Uncharacterized protein n=1 Tax=Thalictrum thalictroides TaxID=46969 RepID=A0A7J6V588_THATH|nr:hypothetical protein FRX31_030179 [Thalictrum thalictroides]
MEKDSDESLLRTRSWRYEKWWQCLLFGMTYGVALDTIYGPCGPNAAQFMASGPKGFIQMFIRIGFIYGGLETIIYRLRGTSYDVVDVFNSSLAGFGTGALYNYKSGPKPAVVAAAFGGLAAGGFATWMKRQSELN